MTRRFLTERDINEYVAQGVQELVLEPGTVVTDLGRERARAAGLRLVEKQVGAHPAPAPAPTAPSGEGKYLAARVRGAVVARLGEAPDGLDAVIAQVLAELQK